MKWINVNDKLPKYDSKFIGYPCQKNRKQERSDKGWNQQYPLGNDPFQKIPAHNVHQSQSRRETPAWHIQNQGSHPGRQGVVGHKYPGQIQESAYHESWFIQPGDEAKSQSHHGV